MAQLRFPGAQMLGPSLYRRRWAMRAGGSCCQGRHPPTPTLPAWLSVTACHPMSRALLLACSEGTLAYFFSVEALRAAAAGFEEVECEYARVQVRRGSRGGTP